MTTLPTGMPDDAPTTSATTTTSATADRLWPLMTDPSTPAAFSDEFDGADWKPTDGVEPPGLGSRFVGRNSRGELTWTTLATVTVHDPGRAFGWTIQSLDDPVADWCLTIDDDPDGSRLTLTARLGPSELSGLNQAIARHPDRAEELTATRLASLQESMQRTVEGIAALAEGRGEGDAA